MIELHKALQGLIGSLKRFGRNAQVILALLALVLGAAAGVASIGFRYGIDIAQQLFLGFSGERVATLAAALPWWQILLAPAVGGLVVGLLVHFGMPGRRPHAVADVIEASALRGGRMSLTVGLRAAVISALSIGCGASVGREGPVVHLGASIGAAIAKRLHLGRSLSRTLLGCGVAAAIAASFNAPIAGVLFALEVVIGHYALSAFAPVVLASVTGTLISRMHYGDFPAFIVPAERVIASVWEFPAFALLGVVSAIAAVIFMRSVTFAQDTVNRLPLPPWSLPGLCGLAVGIIAIAFPQVLGVGYEATDAALSELYPLWLLIALIAAKTAATAISLGCGFGGGVFSPSLFLGAMVGGSFGVIATSAFPDLSSGHGAYTLIGMGAVAGAVLGAPISTILMIFELTTDYALTIAVMIATVIASIITQQAFGRSFFTWQLERRGVSVTGGQEMTLLHEVKVASVMDRAFETVAPDASLEEVRRRLGKALWGTLFVADETRRLTGVIAYSDLQDAAGDGEDAALTAADVARGHPAVLKADDDLTDAIKVYAGSGEAHLPVVADGDSMTLIGIAHEHEVMLAYQRAVSEARAEERGEV
ncbi:MAG: chloride channel protein [Kiloniellales bacterium]